jgi:hypothetical protein
VGGGGEVVRQGGGSAASVRRRSVSGGGAPVGAERRPEANLAEGRVVGPTTPAVRPTAPRGTQRAGSCAQRRAQPVVQ